MSKHKGELRRMEGEGQKRGIERRGEAARRHAEALTRLRRVKGSRETDGKSATRQEEVPRAQTAEGFRRGGGRAQTSTGPGGAPPLPS